MQSGNDAPLPGWGRPLPPPAATSPALASFNFGIAREWVGPVLSELLW